MQLRELVYVLALAKHLNITRAAAELGITQPALSAFVTNLEQDLGVKLFSRNKKPMSITEAGRIYVEKAERILQLKREFELEISALTRTYPAVLQVGVQAIRAPHIIPSLVIAMKREYPNVELVFHEAPAKSLYDMLKGGVVDFVICNKREEDPQLVIHPLYREKLLIAAAPDHPALRHVSAVSPGRRTIDIRLFRDELLLKNHSGHTIMYYVLQLLQQQKISFAKEEEHYRVETILNLAASGVGVGFVLESYLPYFKLPREPAYFLPAGYDEPIEFAAIYRQDQRENLLQSAFLAIVKQVIRTPPHKLL